LRLFVALEVPGEALLAPSRSLPRFDGVRWLDAGGVHLTLRFIGDVSKEESSVPLAMLEGVRFERFRIEIDGAGFFPNRRRPSVFWAGARDARGALSALKSAVDSALSPAIPPEKRDFVPHITLARFKPRATRRAIEAVSAAYDPPPPVSFDVGRFVLYSSEPRPDGAVHRPLLEVSST